ncbi:unnamed protein product [Calypogeia fissa]
MDWRQGQIQSEHIMHFVLLTSALTAFLTGYVMSSYRMMLTIYLIGVGITLLTTVTDWGYFNRHPLEWWEPRYDDIPSTREIRLKQQQQPHQPFKLINPYCRRC